MQLLPVPGAPGYRVDIANRQAYSMKSGVLRPIKFRTQYMSAVLTINGKSYGTTIWRMMYCAQNGIDITKIPSDLCINMTNGVLTVNTRSDIVNKAARTRKKAAPTLARIEENLSLIRKYYEGDVQPILEYLKVVERTVTYHYVGALGFSKDKAELISGYAVNRFLDRLRDGYPTPNIMSSVFRYARKENDLIMARRDFFDNMKPIEI